MNAPEAPQGHQRQLPKALVLAVGLLFAAWLAWQLFH